MDRKTLTIVLGLALVGCFFLPYYSFGGKGGISGFDIVSAKGGDWQKFIILLIPLAGLLLLLGAMNNSYILGRGLLSWLPLLTILYIILIDPLVKGVAVGDIFKTIGKGYGIGLWITIVTSLVLAFYNPRSRY